MNYLSVCSGIPNRRIRDIKGHRNGRLVAVEFVGLNGESRAMWKCKCDCGGEKVVQSNNLFRDSGTKSCGCLRREANAKKLKDDGPWNEGKSYAINSSERCYKTRHSWAKACLREKGNKCQVCGWAKAKCDVHHIIPKSQGGLNLISNSKILCPNCHRIEHETEIARSISEAIQAWEDMQK